MAATESSASLMREGAGLRRITEREGQLRLSELDDDESAPRPTPEDVLVGWARHLELTLLIASMHDAVHELHLATVDDLLREFTAFDALLRRLAHLDPIRVLQENNLHSPPQLHGTDPVVGDEARLVRIVESQIIHCQIERLETLGREAGLPEVAYRCRAAFDGLRSFMERHMDAPRQSAIDTAGHLYAEGRASIDEVARMMGMSVTDAVALLERRGFHRDVARLTLNDDERRARLDKVRADRLARGGVPEHSTEWAARDVAASQRIEGVDARRWLGS